MLQKILKKIKESHRILLTSHKNPDADAIGSALALYLAINKLNENKDIIMRFVLEDEIPSFLKFLPHSFVVEKLENIDTKYSFDTIICLDCGDLDRIGKVKEFIKDETFIINMDHHISNKKYGNLNYVDTKTSSTSEIIYDFIQSIDQDLDKDTATAIYAGILTDTGSFAYGNVSEATFACAAKLKATGIDTAEIHSNIYGTKSKSKLKLMGQVLNEFEFSQNHRLAYYYLSYDKMKKLEAKREDCEGIVEVLRSFEETEIALFLREESDGTIKGSFRSKEKDVNKLAALFGGGGHVRAAGFKTDKSYEQIIRIIKSNI